MARSLNNLVIIQTCPPLPSLLHLPYSEIDPSEFPREFLATHLNLVFSGSNLIAPEQSTLPVLGDIGADNVLDMQLHIDFVARVHGDHLVLII